MRENANRVYVRMLRVRVRVRVNNEIHIIIFACF